MTSQLTAHKAAGRSPEDAGALETLWVGTGGIDVGLQRVRHQPVGEPLELAVAQEAAALDGTGDSVGGDGINITHMV